MEDLRYPIGKFTFADADSKQRAAWIDQIAEAPAKLRAAVRGLNAEQLGTPYRPQGWTVRQVVHHVPDSHMNAYVRFKLAMTENEPVIRPYHEDLWAELPDARTADPEISLRLLEAIHERWILFLRSLSDADFTRMFRHPELGTVTLERNTALYAWHGRHHTAQITALRERKGW